MKNSGSVFWVGHGILLQTRPVPVDRSGGFSTALFHQAGLSTQKLQGRADYDNYYLKRWDRFMPRSYALGGHFEVLIDELVKGGRYNNASEVVREALRLLEDREKLRQLKVEEIRRSIEASRRSGVLLSEEEVFDPLEASYSATRCGAGRKKTHFCLKREVFLS
jgi:antitoxin ParD1/3/4